MNVKGFTLMEMMVVVLILAILSGIGLPQYMRTLEKSRASEAITVLAGVVRAEKVYQVTRNTFTNDPNLLDLAVEEVEENCPETADFCTKYFAYTLLQADGSTLRATAERKPAREHYYINLYVDENGTAHTWCATAPVATDGVVPTTNVNALICTSISNRNPYGIIQ